MAIITFPFFCLIVEASHINRMNLKKQGGA
jgi:hypothetical protein